MASARTEIFSFCKILSICKTSRLNSHKFTVRNGAKAKNPPKKTKDLKKFNVWKVLDVFLRQQVSPQFLGFAWSGSRSEKAGLVPEKEEII
jgi:hypothetical protein